jgi:hypothetical protein
MIHRSPGSRTASALAKPATPIQEAEAWWFAYSLLGMIIAEVAYDNKSDPDNADDQIWQRWTW